MTLFDETNAPYSDSNTTTLTEQQPATETQTEQPERSAQNHEQQNHDRQDHGQQNHGQQSDAQQNLAQPGEEKPAPASTDDFASALETFTHEAEETVGEDHVLRGTVLKLTVTHVVVDIG